MECHPETDHKCRFCRSAWASLLGTCTPQRHPVSNSQGLVCLWIVHKRDSSKWRHLCLFQGTSWCSKYATHVPFASRTLHLNCRWWSRAWSDRASCWRLRSWAQATRSCCSWLIGGRTCSRACCCLTFWSSGVQRWTKIARSDPVAWFSQKEWCTYHSKKFESSAASSNI